MKNLKYLIGLFAIIIAFIACNSDDDDNFATVAIRDRDEVDLEDQLALQTYLETHFWNYEEFATITPGADFEIKLDSISGANINKTPLSQQVTSSVVTREGFDYNVFTLNVRQGDGPETATFADSILVSYKGLLLDKEIVNDAGDYDQIVFDASTSSIWFDLPRVVGGFMEGVTQFNGATSITPQPDGTVTYENGGIGAVFMPSGAGFFATTVTRIPIYSPLIFTFQLRAVNDADHDNDGILSQFEDLNGDRDVRSSNSLDDSDQDILGLFNYLDVDDDGDGINTVDENPDPNGDGNPEDALDTDEDGIPDYLDADTVISSS